MERIQLSKRRSLSCRWCRLGTASSLACRRPSLAAHHTRSCLLQQWLSRRHRKCWWCNRTSCNRASNSLATMCSRAPTRPSRTQCKMKHQDWPGNADKSDECSYCSPSLDAYRWTADCCSSKGRTDMNGLCCRCSMPTTRNRRVGTWARGKLSRFHRSAANTFRRNASNASVQVSAGCTSCSCEGEMEEN